MKVVHLTASILALLMLLLQEGVRGFSIPLHSKAVPFRSAITTRRQPSQLKAIPIEVATCLLPTCGGYFSREFGVSYAYGAATSLTAWFVLQRQMLSPATTAMPWNHWAPWHAVAIIFYGIRLSAFLFYRQQTSKRIKEMQKRIEERAESSGSRLARTPFVLSCAYLYFGLCAPLYLTAAVMSQPLGKLDMVMKGLVATTWLGFLVAALGDFTKTFVKARKGEDHLVTGGIFRLLRHPNYTGEMIGWTSSALAGVVAFGALQQFQQWKPWFYLASNLIGVMGINFVLLLATRNLEKKQAEKYGDQDEYQSWTSKSWGGFALPDNDKSKADPHSEVNDEKEDGGTGI